MINCPSCEGYQRDIRQLQTELVAERAKLIVPGSMKCAKCSFGLMRVNLYVRNGTTGPGDNATEPCPNGCGPLWPETWEQAAHDAMKSAQKAFEDLAAERARAAALEVRLKEWTDLHRDAVAERDKLQTAANNLLCAMSDYDPVSNESTDTLDKAADELRERVRQLEKERLYQVIYTPPPVSPLGCSHERWTTIATLGAGFNVEHKRQCLACKSIF